MDERREREKREGKWIGLSRRKIETRMMSSLVSLVSPGPEKEPNKAKNSQ